jgi:DNA-binding transcriptional LysR family regulator
VISGALDLALLSLPGQPPADLTLRFVSAEPLLVVCHPAHPLAARRSVTLEEIADDAFIDFTPGWGNRAVVDRAFAAAGLDRQVRFEVADFASAAALVRHGLGITFLPVSVVAATAPGLPAIEVAGHSLCWRISVATPAHRRVSAASRAFLAELLRAAGSSP